MFKLLIALLPALAFVGLMTIHARAQECYTVDEIAAAAKSHAVPHVVMRGSDLKDFEVTLAKHGHIVPDGATAAIAAMRDGKTFYGLEVGGCTTGPTELTGSPV